MPRVCWERSISSRRLCQSFGSCPNYFLLTFDAGFESVALSKVLRLARNLPAGSLLIDAGVFDGTDWSLMGILAGVTVVGFEPLRENRKLVSDRLPVQLGEYQRSGDAYTFLHIEPGEPVSWFQVPKSFYLKSFSKMLNPKRLRVKPGPPFSGRLAGRSVKSFCFSVQKIAMATWHSHSMQGSQLYHGSGPWWTCFLAAVSHADCLKSMLPVVELRSGLWIWPPDMTTVASQTRDTWLDLQIWRLNLGTKRLLLFGWDGQFFFGFRVPRKRLQWQLSTR